MADVYLPLSQPPPDQEPITADVEVDCDKCKGLGWTPFTVRDSDGEHTEHEPCADCGGNGVRKEQTP